MASSADREWIHDAIARYEQPLLRFAASVVGRGLAADVVQDAFVALCKADRPSLEGQVGSWLFVVCRNRAIELRRQHSRLQPFDEDEEMTQADERSMELDRGQPSSSIHEIVAELPAKQRRALTLKFSAGMSYKEIAQVMDLTVTNVGFILHTAIKTIRQRLADESEPAPMRSVR